MTQAKVCWWEINAVDGGNLAKFYAEVFGWESNRDKGSGIWHIPSGGEEPGTISGGVFTGKGVLPTHRCLYVEVDDVDAVAASAERMECPMLQGPFDIDGGKRLAFFRDPEGHMIGLISRKRD